MAESTLNIGQELHSDSIVYRIESVLGQGSFGITYKAKAFTVMKGKFGEELVETNTPKAIKEFFMKEINDRDASGSITGISEGSLSYNYAQKFKKEAENLASMNHPNIVKVIDFISANNTYYYVMDYIDGENLNDYLKHHKMSEKEATDTILEVAKALQYMHEEKHMLHLDLKPGNIMRRNSDGHIFLIDFGLSKHYSEDGVPETSTSVGLGTPGYAPIEQANSNNSKLFRETLDIYALGATFYKLLTGKTPTPASELVSDEELASNELGKTGISQNLISVIVHSMTPNVKKRTGNVALFISELYKNIDINNSIIPNNEGTVFEVNPSTVVNDVSKEATSQELNEARGCSTEGNNNKKVIYYWVKFYFAAFAIALFCIFLNTSEVFLMAMIILFGLMAHKNISHDGAKPNNRNLQFKQFWLSTICFTHFILLIVALSSAQFDDNESYATYHRLLSVSWFLGFVGCVLLLIKHSKGGMIMLFVSFVAPFVFDYLLNPSGFNGATEIVFQFAAFTLTSAVMLQAKEGGNQVFKLLLYVGIIALLLFSQLFSDFQILDSYITTWATYLMISVIALYILWPKTFKLAITT